MPVITIEATKLNKDVQMTFRRDGLNGYKVDDINVVTT
jgi:hypothetical protein